MSEQTEIKTTLSIEELKIKYGVEVVEIKIKQIEEQVKEKVVELDESLFVQSTLKPEPEIPTEEEIIQIIGLMTCLYLAEGKTLFLVDAQKKKQLKHIPHQFKQRLNNLFVNNRVLMDYFHKRFNWDDVSYQNELADSVETMINLFIACKQEDRIQCINDFKKILETKYITNAGTTGTNG